MQISAHTSNKEISADSSSPYKTNDRLFKFKTDAISCADVTPNSSKTSDHSSFKVSYKFLNDGNL